MSRGTIILIIGAVSVVFLMLFYVISTKEKQKTEKRGALETAIALLAS